MSEQDASPPITRGAIYRAIEELDAPLHQTIARLKHTSDGTVASLSLDYRIPWWIFASIALASWLFGAVAVWAIHAGGAVPTQVIQPLTWLIVAFCFAVPLVCVGINLRNVRRNRLSPSILEHHSLSGALRVRGEECELSDPVLLCCTCPLRVQRGAYPMEQPAALLALIDHEHIYPLVMFPSGVTDLRQDDKDAVARFAVEANLNVRFAGIQILDAKRLRPCLDRRALD